MVDIQDPASTQFQITGACKLLGFFENKESFQKNFLMCILETTDNQIDFAKLIFPSRELDLILGDFEFV